MTKKRKEKEPPKAIIVKKLYVIRADDVDVLETWPDDDTQIRCVQMKRGGRIVQIDDNEEGRNIMASHIRRIVGDKAMTRLVPPVDKSDKPV